MNGELILRLFVAGILGAVIGLDRAYRAKEAGFRTHFLVSLGSALFMIVSQYGFSDLLGSPDIHLDPSRIAAQIVSGIGFLGAGTIIFQKQFVRGLTTAAGLWATAGIGMAIGGGMYVLGTAATVLTLAGLELFTLIFRSVGMRTILFSFSTTEQDNLNKVINEITLRKHKIVSYTTQESRLDDGTISYNVGLALKLRRQRDENELFSFLQNLPRLTLTGLE